LLAWTLGGECRGNIALHRVRSSDTRDNAFVEARPGRKKISRNLLHAISPHSPGFILLACPSSSIDFEPRHSGFVRFTSNCKLLADRQGVSGVVAESSRSRPGWQFYINKSTAHYTANEAEPRGCEKPRHIIRQHGKPFNCIHPIYYRHRCDQFSDLLQNVSFQSLPRAV
jgi:hypothetical protein